MPGRLVPRFILLGGALRRGPRPAGLNDTGFVLRARTTRTGVRRCAACGCGPGGVLVDRRERGRERRLSWMRQPSRNARTISPSGPNQKFAATSLEDKKEATPYPSPSTDD